MRRYPETVEAEMYRVVNGNDVFLLRQRADIFLGNPLHTATVIMTNPGSFDFKNVAGWEIFKAGLGESDYFYGKDYPDLTMQNVIEVIRGAYDGFGSPCCRVEIVNISNIVNPKGTSAEEHHNKVKSVIGDNVRLLQSTLVTNQENFQNKCRQSDFIIMGFVKNVFKEEVIKLINWARPFHKKIVVATDNVGWYSHPRRWRTERYLKTVAIHRLSEIIQCLYR